METPKRLAPTTETLRSLFAKSGNQCAFPDCKHPLVDEEHNFIAEVCHIEDAMPGGRFNPNMTNEERRNYKNLVLFCHRHHVQTANIEKFSVSDLRQMKTQHEAHFLEEDDFVVDEGILINIFNDLEGIKADTAEILKATYQQTIQLDRMEALLLLLGQETNVKESHYSNEINRIVQLRDSNNQQTVLQLLGDFRKKEWENLNNSEKYKLIANIGICYIEVGEEEKGAKHFIDLINYNPDYDKALGFIAVGYSLQGKPTEARKYIDKAISKDTKNINAYLALIELEKDNSTISEILNQIPSELHNTPEIAYSIGSLARYQNDFNTAITWLQNALNITEKNFGQLKATLAATILDTISNPFQIIMGQLTIESRNKIKYCIQLFTEAWDEYKDSDLRKSKAWILINRGVAKKFLKDFEGAFADMKYAISISGNDYLALRHLAILDIQMNNLDEAMEILKQLKSIENQEDKDDISIELLEAEILLKKKNYAQAIEILKILLQNTSNPRIIEELHNHLILAYLSTNRWEEAEKFSLSIIEEESNHLGGYINASKVYFHLNKSDKALNFLNKAYELITKETHHADIQDLAYEYVKHKDYIKASQILELITDTKIYTDLSSSLLWAYYKAGEYGKALKLCQTIRENHGPVDEVADIQSSIYESIGDLSKAIEVCEEYLSVYPDGQRIRIRLALIFTRLREYDKVKEKLNSLNALGELPYIVLYQLAYLHICVGNYEKGLEIAYETRRKNINNGNAHLKYVGLLMDSKGALEPFYKIQKVSINTAVKVRDEQGNIYTYYILESSETPSQKELLSTELLAQTLMGLEIGDVAEISRSFGEPQKFEVLGILHKYNYALLESTDLLNTRFVDIQGFRVFDFKPTGNIRQDLKPLFDTIDQDEYFDKQLQEYYHQGLFTIGACARMKGSNPIEFWSVAVRNSDYGIQSLYLTDPINFSVTQVVLNKETSIVIDLISLLTLASLKKLELLEMVSCKKLIASSSIECISDFMRSYDGIGSKEHIRIGKVNGKYVRESISEEQILNNQMHYDALLIWIKNNCEVVPCNEALVMNAFQKEQFDSTLGKPFIDSILISKEYQCFLLADERSLRSIAFYDFQVKGFSTFALIDYYLKKEQINISTYNEIVSAFIEMNYRYLPVNAEILMKCVEKADYLPRFPLDLALETLGHSISNEDNAILIATDFFFYICGYIEIPQLRLNLILAVLEILCKGRDFITILRKLLPAIEIRFRVLQPQKDDVIKIIKAYINTRQQSLFELI